MEGKFTTMTTSNGRSAESRRSARSVGQWLLGLLIVLALVASVLMVFTDQLSLAGSTAVIAALWAAVIGAILVTKFRRQAESAEAKSRDLRLVYELQLEREISARRQYELDVEATIRKEVAEESNAELGELKKQVLALRSSLEMLIGEPLPDTRAALGNEKLRELASGLGGAGGFAGQFGGSYTTRGSYGSGGYAYAAPDDDVVAARDFAATAPAPGKSRRVSGGVDPNEMTEIIPVIRDDDPISGRIATEVPFTTANSYDAPSGADTSYADTVDVEEVAPEQVAEPEIAADAGAEIVVDEVAVAGFETADADTAAAETSEPATFVRDTETVVAESAESAHSPVDDTTAPAEDAALTDEPAIETPAAEAPALDETAADSAVDASADTARFVDDTPTDSWPAGRHESAHTYDNADYSGPAHNGPAHNGPAHNGSAYSATSHNGGYYGAPAHNGNATPAAPNGSDVSTMPGRRHRREDEDDTHSAGLPVSELLSQLRQSGAPGGGRRRRED